MAHLVTEKYKSLGWKCSEGTECLRNGDDLCSSRISKACEPVLPVQVKGINVDSYCYQSRALPHRTISEDEQVAILCFLPIGLCSRASHAIRRFNLALRPRNSVTVPQYRIPSRRRDQPLTTQYSCEIRYELTKLLEPLFSAAFYSCFYARKNASVRYTEMWSHELPYGVVLRGCLDW